MTNTETNDFIKLGKAIKKQRLKLGFTRVELSKRLNISSDYLSKIENKGHTPSLKLLRKLVHILNLSIDPYFQPTINVDKSLQHKKIERVLQQYSEGELEFISHLLEQGIIFKNKAT